MRLEPVRYLKASAQVAAKIRGHLIGLWVAGPGETLASECRHCGAEAVIDPPKGCVQTAVSGPATTTHCRRTPP
jgi:hypothetical protein